MDLLKNIKLIKSDESKVSSTDVLAGKTFICLYFSANWCPDMTPLENKIGLSNLIPNRGFTPILKEFYDKVKTEGVEIIFSRLKRLSPEPTYETVFFCCRIFPSLFSVISDF